MDPRASRRSFIMYVSDLKKRVRILRQLGGFGRQRAFIGPKPFVSGLWHDRDIEESRLVINDSAETSELGRINLSEKRDRRVTWMNTCFSELFGIQN